MRKKIIVLGGSSGIGKAIAERFAKEGWQVLLAAHNYTQCIEVVDGLEGREHLAFGVTTNEEGKFSISVGWNCRFACLLRIEG